MMNFNQLFNNLQELEDSAIAFRNGYPVRYIFSGQTSEFTFYYENFQEYAEKKVMSKNNGTLCWIDGRTMYVIPRMLGNAEDILAAEGYTFGPNSGNNYYVPLSNGESLMVDPFKNTHLDYQWTHLKAVAYACANKL